jgi:DnaK suppressor protein
MPRAAKSTVASTGRGSKASTTKSAAKASTNHAKKAAKTTAKTTAKATKATAKTTKTKATTKAGAPAKAATKKATPTKQATNTKTAAKAAAPKAPAKKAGGAAGDKFLEAQRKALLEERDTYTRQAQTLKAEADALAEDMEPGDVQFDEESGEGDTINVERERDLALSAQALAAVEEIDRALAKIDEGTYGVCEQCGEQIPKERLRALPYAALCVRCKSAGLSTRR